MLSLQSHHIADLYVWVDDLIPKQEKDLSKGGRPQLLFDSEIITVLIWNTLILHQKNIKDIHRFMQTYLEKEFPRIPKYNTFLENCHKVTPTMFGILQLLFDRKSPIIFMDSTMVPVCKLKRADHHKVAKKFAKFGKNHQGWHYGFKLHAGISENKTLTAIAFTPANMHDAQMMPHLVNEYTRVGVGDSHYGARVMGRYLWEKYGTMFVAPPHFTQKKKLATPFQNKLLSDRSKIEAVFDILKEHLHFVSTFPRSVFGYLVHYVRILLGYQIMALMR
jgi:hypothetical protein